MDEYNGTPTCSSVFKCPKCSKTNFDFNFKLVTCEEPQCYKCYYEMCQEQYTKLKEKHDDLDKCMRECMTIIYRFNLKHNPEFSDD